MKDRIQNTVMFEIKTSCGSLFVTVGDKYFRCHFGKNGSCFSAMSDVVNHFVKFLIKKDVDNWHDEVAGILSNIRCVQPFWDDGEHCLSCFDAIAKVLKKYNEIKKK